jgi:autotransporter-associated beta strand protein
MVVSTAVQPAAYAASIVFRHSLVGTVLLALALALSSTGRAQGQQNYNYYSSYTSLTPIPFANGPLNSSSRGATVFMQLTGGAPTAFTMDTGSTGIVVSSDYFTPGVNDIPQGAGSVTYTSSNITYKGTYYLTDVGIMQTATVGNNSTEGKAGPQLATSRVTVLAVDQVCNVNGCGKPSPIAYMGIGYDRDQMSTVAPAGSTINAFTNITSLASGAPLSTLRQGYVVSNTGITLGLSTAATQNFGIIKLVPDTSKSFATAGIPWSTAPMTVRVNDGANTNPGNLLPDTGIEYMFLNPGPNNGFQTTPCNGGSECAIAGTKIEVWLPGQAGTAASFTYIAPDPNDTSAGRVESAGDSGAGFINTGRQFYENFIYFYDDVGGYVGYRTAPTTKTWDKTGYSPGLSLIGTVPLFDGFASSLSTFLMGATTIQQTGTGTISGDISGSGGLTISGGLVNLTGINSYTGGTTVTGGATLGINADSGLGDPSGGLTLNNGTLLAGGNININPARQVTIGAGGGTFDTNGFNVVLGSAITGTGGLTANGLGMLTLSGTNTYTGGTIVSGGTVAIDSDVRLGHVSGGLTLNGGTLLATGNITGASALARSVTMGAGGGTFDTNSFNVVLGTAVTGVGSLTKNGLGVLTLSGANSYTGGTTVNAGTLLLGAGASLPTTGPLTVNGGSLDFNGNNVTIGSLSGLGGTIALGAGTLTVAEQGSTAFAGTLTGTGGLTMQGSGMLSLTGVNTYTGPTSITGGRLAVNGSITSNVTVGAFGNLGGTGTIFGTVTNNGVSSPGNSIGTLNVVGAYTQAAGSSYQVETNAAGQADRINVTGAPGTATIAGGTVTLTAASGVYAPSTTYTILNATGGVTGTYAGANSLYPFLQPSLAYDTNNVYLTLRPGGFGAGAATPNQAAVGRVVDQSVAGSSGDFATVIGTMATYTQGQGQAALNALSGQNYSGFGTANLGGGLLFMNMMGQQMSLARGGVASGTRVAVAQACEAAAVEVCDGDAATPWTLWGSALGGTGSVAGNANAGALSFNASGFAAGADYRFDSRFLAGFAVGYANGNQWASGFSGQGTTNSFQASLYASFTQAAFYLDGMAGYGYNDNQMTRQIVLPNLAARTAQGRVGANQFLGQLETGYRIGINEPAAASITPFARFQGTTNSQQGFSESGAGSLNLTVAPQTTGSARSALGAELAGAFGPEGREKLALQLRLGWAHEYADTTRPVTASFAGAPGANFTVFGAAPTRDAANFSLAANTAVAPGVSLYARYDGETGNGTSTHALYGGLRMNW